MKIIFVLGGLFSGIGKGIVTSSIAKLLQLNQKKVTVQKHDPYLNIDCHWMNPSEHGEVFVTKDSLETDLDLGNYERFLNQDLTKMSCVTSGQIYQDILNKQSLGKYGGQTVNIYNVCQAIEERINELYLKTKSDFLVVELGGTIGDNDSNPFLMASVQLQRKLGIQNVAFIFLNYISYFSNLETFKTKPTQNSIALLRGYGIEPDFVILRSHKPLTKDISLKIAKFCYLNINRIFTLPDTNIYLVPSLFFQQGLFQKILDFFHLPLSLDTKKLFFLPKQIELLEQSSREIKIAIVGKYPNFKQTYLSIYEALYAAALNTKINFKYEEVDCELITKENITEVLSDFDGVVVPGGFGHRGLEGILLAIQFARENKIPFFGVCLGMQLALIEFALNVLKIKKATSAEFTKDSSLPFIIDYIDPINKKMFIGEKKIRLIKNSLAFQIFNQEIIFGRHRNRLTFNNKYKDLFFKNGMFFSAFSEDDIKILEIIELQNHPFFLATQFHIEWNSYPEKANPLFVAFFNQMWLKKK